MSQNKHFQSKAVSLKNIKFKKSLLNQNKESFLKLSQIDESNPKASFMHLNMLKEGESTQPSYLLNPVLTRKYSHINKLAQGLVL